MFTSGVTEGSVLNDVQNAFIALRNATERITELQNWSAGVAVGDLVALGFTNADATAILSGITESGQTVTTYNANSTFQREVMGSQP